MKQATSQQKAAIKKLAHNANQIIDRALPGQAEHLKYNVKAMTGAERFSGATAGLSYEAAEKRLEDLNRFYEAKTITKAGWRDVVERAVNTANTTLSQMGFDLSSTELAETLKQLNEMQTADRYVGLTAKQKQAQKRREFYEAVEKVNAAKTEAQNWKGDADEIGKALANQISEQQALKIALENREQ